MMRLNARGTERGVLRRRCRPVVHHVEVSPSPNSLSLDYSWELRLRSRCLTPIRILSLRNASPLVIIAQMIRASLLASATEASRADFFFSRSGLGHHHHIAASISSDMPRKRPGAKIIAYQQRRSGPWRYRISDGPWAIGRFLRYWQRAAAA